MTQRERQLRRHFEDIFATFELKEIKDIFSEWEFEISIPFLRSMQAYLEHTKPKRKKPVRKAPSKAALSRDIDLDIVIDPRRKDVESFSDYSRWLDVISSVNSEIARISASKQSAKPRKPIR